MQGRRHRDLDILREGLYTAPCRRAVPDRESALKVRVRIRFFLDRFLAVLLLAALTAAPPLAYAGHKQAHASSHVVAGFDEEAADSHPDLHEDRTQHAHLDHSHPAHSHDDGSVDHSHEPGGPIIVQVLDDTERPFAWRDALDTSVARGLMHGLERPPRVLA